MKTSVLRPVVIDDIVLLFEWANQAEVRMNAINSAEIIWEEHQKWFEERIHSDRTKMFILEDHDKPVAQIRFDFKAGEWHIDFSVSANERGKGYGKVVVQEGLRKMKDRPVVALVKVSNAPSRAVFTSLGFGQQDCLTIDGVRLFKFTI